MSCFSRLTAATRRLFAFAFVLLLRVTWGAGLWLGGLLLSWAGVPKPDFVVYGNVRGGCQRPWTPEMGVRAEARTESGQLVASTILGADPENPFGYVLRVATDSGAPPLRPDTVPLDEVLTIVIVHDQQILFQAEAYVGGHGLLLPLHFGDDDGTFFEEADAGPDLQVCAVSVQLQAAVPQLGSGTWTVLSGRGGVLADPGEPHTSFSGLAGETYRLRWQLDNPPCDQTQDETLVTFLGEGAPADAGADRTLCGVTTTFLNAARPVVGTGSWTILAGNGGRLMDRRDPWTEFRGVAGETYRLLWRLSMEGCGAVEDEVIVAFQTGSVTPVAIEGPASACVSRRVFLTATPGFAAYRWSTGETTSGIWVDAALTETYSVVATAADGCSAAAHHEVVRTAGELALRFDHAGVTLCDGNDTFALTVSASCGAGAPYSYQWRVLAGPGEGGVFDEPEKANPRFTPRGFGVYRLGVTVTDRDGTASDIATTVYHVNRDLNGDGVGDSADFGMHLLVWGATPVWPAFDLDESGAVNVLDLLLHTLCP